MKQGCTFSSRLFYLYINDTEEYLNHKKAPSVKLFTSNRILLLHDIVILVSSKENLQNLHLASEYFKEKWLALNINKSVVMMFRTSRKIGGLTFSYRGEEMKNSGRI